MPAAFARTDVRRLRPGYAYLRRRKPRQARKNPLAKIPAVRKKHPRRKHPKRMRRKKHRQKTNRIRSARNCLPRNLRRSQSCSQTGRPKPKPASQCPLRSGWHRRFWRCTARFSGAFSATPSGWRWKNRSRGTGAQTRRYTARSADTPAPRFWPRPPTAEHWRAPDPRRVSRQSWSRSRTAQQPRDSCSAG